MACEVFIPKKFSAAHDYVIKQANKIIAEYVSKGHTLTLRQLYYQFVARALIANKQTEYKRLGNIIDAARKAGLIDWDAIEDRTRNLRRIPVWNTPEQAVERIKQQFKLDPWDEQPIPRRIEVWIEKDALVGVIQPVCNRFRLPYFSCRGYGSSTELYEAGKRLAAFRAAGYEVLVLHLGDHDPSGVQMTEDNQTRLDLFSREDIEFRRIAMTMEQIEQYNPPPNFVKQTDSRTVWYVETFGTEDCWELDALDPPVIDTLIESHVQPLIDQAAWDATMEREKAHIETLDEIISDWNRTKAAPAMLNLIREHAALTIEGKTIPEEETTAYEEVDSATLAMVVDDCTHLIEEHGLE